MDILKRMFLILALITMLNPGVHAWVQNNVIYIDKDGEVVEIRYNHTEIGTAWSHTIGEQPVEK